MNPRATPRVKKGVKKVDEHQVKENAATLLVVLAQAMKIDNPETRQEFLSQVTNELEEVVDNFGFARDRIYGNAGNRFTQIHAQIVGNRDIANLKAHRDRFSSIIDSLDANPDDIRESIEDSDGSIHFDKGVAARDTRHGSVRKRQKLVSGIDEAAKVLVDMKKTLEAMKADDNGGRRNSSIF